jgi:hypothetical protein
VSQCIEQCRLAGISGDGLPDAGRQRGQGVELLWQEPGESRRAQLGRDVQVGDAADPAHQLVGPVALRVDPDDVFGGLEGHAGPGRILECHHPKQRRQLAVRPIVESELLDIAGEVGLYYPHPVGPSQMRLSSVGQLPGFVEIGLGVAREPDERQDEGTIPEPPRRFRLARHQPLRVE